MTMEITLFGAMKKKSKSTHWKSKILYNSRSSLSVFTQNSEDQQLQFYPTQKDSVIHGALFMGS